MVVHVFINFCIAVINFALVKLTELLKLNIKGTLRKSNLKKSKYESNFFKHVLNNNHGITLL